MIFEKKIDFTTNHVEIALLEPVCFLFGKHSGNVKENASCLPKRELQEKKSAKIQT